jgi:hypothetical protein
MLSEAMPSMSMPNRLAVSTPRLIACPQGIEPIAVGWTAEAERELRKIPFFVRGKARRNTERFASERGVMTITLETCTTPRPTLLDETSGTAE